MDELNLHLQSFIQEACSHVPASPQHRKALNCLLRAVLKSGCLWTPAAGDIYEEALYKTMFNLTKTLCDKYDPSRGSFLAWFNTCLRNQYMDEIRATQRDRSSPRSLYGKVMRWRTSKAEISSIRQEIFNPRQAFDTEGNLTLKKSKLEAPIKRVHRLNNIAGFQGLLRIATDYDVWRQNTKAFSISRWFYAFNFVAIKSIGI
ncbi:hypothetical protein [Tolypothrix sp. VBCCA 56010]|uniref:hypothetical protein n=1 Tax=Tolypothrix sp. VBCCA 56010 TaxID=3137731 RepID=UPI003D7EC9C8